MPDIKRVYVAGAYSADNVLDVLDNIRIGIQTAAEVFDAGLSPFCPWLDMHYCFTIPGERLSVDKFRAYSMDFLEVCDAVLLAPNKRNHQSKGTIAEIERAEELGIPVFHTLGDLLQCRTRK